MNAVARKCRERGFELRTRRASRTGEICAERHENHVTPQSLLVMLEFMPLGILAPRRRSIPDRRGDVDIYQKRRAR